MPCSIWIDFASYLSSLPVATRKLPLTNPPRTPTIISLESLLSPEAEQHEGRPGLEEEDRLQYQLCCVDFSKPLPLLTTNSGTRSHTFCSVEMLEGKLQMQTLRKCQCTYYHSLPLIHIHAIFALCILAKPFQVHSTKYPMVINFLRQRLSLYNILQSVRLTSKASWPRWQVGNVVGNIQTRSVLPGRAHAFGYSAQRLKDTAAQPGVVWKNGGFSVSSLSVSEDIWVLYSISTTQTGLSLIYLLSNFKLDLASLGLKTWIFHTVSWLFHIPGWGTSSYPAG